jgi:hypothetical protein
VDWILKANGAIEREPNEWGESRARGDSSSATVVSPAVLKPTRVRVEQILGANRAIGWRKSGQKKVRSTSQRTVQAFTLMINFGVAYLLKRETSLLLSNTPLEYIVCKVKADCVGEAGAQSAHWVCAGHEVVGGAGAMVTCVGCEGERKWAARASDDDNADGEGFGVFGKGEALVTLNRAGALARVVHLTMNRLEPCDVS